MRLVLFFLSIILFSCNSKVNVSSFEDKAPSFSLPNINNEIVDLTDFKGNFVLIDFWASWCRPCRTANKELVLLYEKYKSKDFEILGVSLDGIPSQENPRQDWLNAIKDDKITWTNISDLKGWGSYLVELYNIRSIPHAVLLNKEGKIIAEKISIKTLENELEKILNANQN